MPSNFKIGVAVQNVAVDAVVDRIDTGTGAGRMEIRTGGPPASITGSSTGTLLGTLTFSNPAFGNGSSGTATANAITSDTNADASGDAGYFRVYRGGAADTAPEWQGTAGNSGDTPDMVFSPTKSVVAGGTIAVNSFTVTMPAS